MYCQFWVKNLNKLRKTNQSSINSSRLRDTVYWGTGQHVKIPSYREHTLHSPLGRTALYWSLKNPLKQYFQINPKKECIIYRSLNFESPLVSQTSSYILRKPRKTLLLEHYTSQLNHLERTSTCSLFFISCPEFTEKYLKTRFVQDRSLKSSAQTCIY